MQKTALVTGGSRGIGFEIAKLLIAEGFKVAICARTKSELTEATKKLGNNCKSFQCDVSRSEDVQSLLKNISNEFGTLNVLINNAGIGSFRPLEQQVDEQIESLIRTNLEGLIKVTRDFLPIMRDMIINIASGAGKQGFANFATYCATKFGVRGFTQALAREKPHLKIVSVNPGLTSTKMTNYRGIPAEKVAKVVLDTIKGKIKPDRNYDIDVWEHM